MTSPDVQHLREVLVELPDLAAQLPDLLIQRRAGQVSRGTPGSRPPLRLDVAALLDQRDRTDWTEGMVWCDPESVGLLPYLWGWVRDIEADALDEGIHLPSGDAPQAPTLSSVCDWLRQALDYASGLPQWPELAWGIETCWRRTKAIVEGRSENRSVLCPRCTIGQLTRPGAQAQWECGQCGYIIIVQAVTLRQAAPLVGVSLRTLYRWDARRLITSVFDEQGRRWWDLGDIRRVAAQTRLG